MTDNVLTPSISIYEDNIRIIGTKEGLRTLGEALIQKAEIGKRLHVRYCDGISKPIDIYLDDEMPSGEAMEALRKDKLGEVTCLIRI